jgi:hypothetical protein
MKRMMLTATLLGFIMLLAVPGAEAAPPDFGGGVNNEYDYEEVVFVSGTPVKFVGSGKDINIKTSEKADSRSITYRLKLTSAEADFPGSLNRSITYKTTLAKYSDKGQTTAQMEVDKFSEKIEIGEDKYELTDYQFSRSDIIDNRPASDYYSGSLKARKTYMVNKNEGKITMDISGAMVGYENFWGKTETQQLEYVIECDRTLITEDDEGEEDSKDLSWQGTVTITASDSMAKTLKYADNQATLSSFSGGHSRITNQDMYSRYDFNLPRIVNGQVAGSRLRSGIELKMEMSPRIERLVVPKFRDVAGHWAQNDIEKLYSLDVFEGAPSFFAPDAPMTRVEFTRAIVKGANMRPSLVEQPRQTARSRTRTVEVSPFRDVLVTSPDYQYIKDGVERGIISGVSEDLFGPEQSLTRAQAITIMVRALGFENMAPTPGFQTSFADDYFIPNWALDSVYVAREIGLISGDASNRVNPNQVLTRGEASSMLVRFLNFLEQDLQRDYREDLVLF